MISSHKTSTMLVGCWLLIDDLDPRWAAAILSDRESSVCTITNKYPIYYLLPTTHYPLPTTHYPLPAVFQLRDSAPLFTHSHYLSDRSNQSVLVPLLSYFVSQSDPFDLFSDQRSDFPISHSRSMSLLISTLSYTHYLSPSTATPHRPVTSSHRPILSWQ
jgi:hypothetical protein